MSQELCFGVVGAGMIADYHIQAMEGVEGARAKAVFGPTPERADALAKKHGLKAYYSLDAMLADPDINAVSIASPTGKHAEAAVAAAQAGRHILCEKPLDITPARGQEIIDACRKAGVILAPIFQYRYGFGAALIREALAKGRFGRVLFSSARIKWFRSQAYYDSGAWRGTWDLDGGGCLMNQSIHAIDLMVSFAGVPAQVFGTWATRSHAIKVEDVAVAMVRFENGVMGTIEASTACQPGFPLEVEVSGERGTATLRGDQIARWSFVDEDPMDAKAATVAGEMGSGASDPKGISVEGHKQVIANMVKALRGDASGLVDPVEARYPIDIICGIYEAQKTGAPVALPWKSGTGAGGR